MELCRFTIDENPELDGQCCKFYQFNGCPNTKSCKERFIHPPIRNNNRQHSYGNRNQNSREHQKTFCNSETNFFIHACKLCLSLRKGYGHHPLFKCEILIELDKIAQDPKNYVPVLMVPKIRTIKTDPLTNFEENITGHPLPTIKLRPNQELFSNIKLEEDGIVQIDD